ncbi:MAG: hypothetical protein ABF679_12560 [Lentilactobacillus diolivorans]|nr:hypothetical protein [Lentilactobacillus diolivorans]MDH5107172.1 hypothetical protein [Lentilactobacillus diolivorans]GEP24614.1 hypothetical protein LDI01_22070 [Lentilactobacillus diolivorans]
MSDQSNKMTPEQRQKAAEFIKGVNIPYRVFSTEDKLFMVFVFDNSKAIGIFSNDGPTDQDDLRSRLDQAITNELHYRFKRSGDQAAIDGHKMALYPKAAGASERFIFYGQPGLSEDMVKAYFAVVVQHLTRKK